MDSDVFFLSKVRQRVYKSVTYKVVYDRLSELPHICDHDVVWHTFFILIVMWRLIIWNLCNNKRQPSLLLSTRCWCPVYLNCFCQIKLKIFKEHYSQEDGKNTTQIENLVLCVPVWQNNQFLCILITGSNGFLPVSPDMNCSCIRLNQPIFYP